MAELVSTEELENALQEQAHKTAEWVFQNYVKAKPAMSFARMRDEMASDFIQAAREALANRKAGEWRDGQHELLPFLALWAGQYQRDSGLDGIHPIHHALLAKYGAPMENFPLATNLPAPPLPLTDAGG